MNALTLPDISKLTYDPASGLFCWRVSSTRVKAGDIAGTPDWKGYIRIRIGATKYQAHRLAWLFMTGDDPGALTIDHINGDKGDNRFDNLRLATNSENQRNKGRYACKSSGFKGVYWHKTKGRFYAAIRADGRLHHLGYFDSEDDARKAYAVAAERLHGEFKNLGGEA
jgi:hypothetical protein